MLFDQCPLRVRQRHNHGTVTRVLGLQCEQEGGGDGVRKARNGVHMDSSLYMECYKKGGFSWGGGFVTVQAVQVVGLPDFQNRRVICHFSSFSEMENFVFYESKRVE